ncbi:MAG: hypothetical protein JXR83_16380 [Deltaproteobacteria bacterium]|nr:hypothetical protein [Deltaproteobacteria bacterium]
MSGHCPPWFMAAGLCLLVGCPGAARPMAPEQADAGPDDAARFDAGELPRQDPDYLVVAADILVEPAREFAAYRSQAGFRTAVYARSELSPESQPASDLAAAVRALLQTARDLAPADETHYLLLVGDAPGLIPALPCTNELGGCYTDNLYADLDADGVADAAVGRVAANTIEEVRAFLSKVQTHEASYETGVWNRRLAMFTGAGGFGDDLDAMLEQVVLAGLDSLDYAFDIVGAYNNPENPYYFVPFDQKVLELFNGGSLATLYIGHGSSSEVEGLSASQIDGLHCAHRLPLALLFACLNGAFAGRRDSIAEILVERADGPIACFAASDVSHPYGNAVLSFEVERALLNSRPPTVGAVILAAKRQVLINRDSFRTRLDTSAALAGMPADEQLLVQQQHLNLYNLLGDPATRMQYPRSSVVFEPGVSGTLAHAFIDVGGRTPNLASGTAIVTLEIERSAIVSELAPFDPENPDPETVQANWAAAVDKAVAGVEVAVSAGGFAARLPVPQGLPVGLQCYVKVYAHDGIADSFGAVAVPR